MSTLLSNDHGMPSGGVGHPAPHRARLSLLILGIGVFGAPAAWILQMLLSYGLASHSC